MKVLCGHNNTTAPLRNFSCKHPGVGKVTIPLSLGLPVMVEEEIALLHPNVFRILPTPVAKDEEVKPDPIDATDEPEKVEPEPTEGEKPFAVDLVDDGTEKCEESVAGDDTEDEDTEPVDADQGKRDLIAAIDDFKTKKKLLDYAKSCKTELDSSIKLSEMKEALKVAWELV